MNSKSLLILALVVNVITKCKAYYEDFENNKSSEFTFNFYRVVFDENQNTIVSPFSFRGLLTILYQSETGNSESELREKVYLGEKEYAFKNLQRSLYNFSSNTNIKILNKIFIKNESSVKPDFLEIVKELGSNIELVDFSQNEEIASNINRWVEEQTNGLITDLVSPDTISQETVLFLVNTLYFKAQWREPFQELLVFKRSFKAINGLEYKIDMMYDNDEYNVAILDNIKAKVLEIPYTEESNFLFWVLLPNEDSNIVELKDFLSNNIIKEITLQFEKQIYDISLPKFEIESSIDGVESLRKLGVESIFTNYESFILDNHEGLRVSDIKQKSKIKVSTNGTECASGTYMKLSDRILHPRFEINRPFIYMILTADTYEPVYIGHFSKPT